MGVKKQNTKQKKTTVIHMPNKKTVFRIYKKPLSVNEKRTDKTIEKCAKNLNRNSTKEDIQITNKHMKRYSTSSVRKMQIKTIM